MSPAPVSPSSPRLHITCAAGPARLAAVCTVDSLFPVHDSGIMSGINKKPREGDVQILTHGVLGDVNGDKEHHGGIFKAVYAVARESREALAAQEGLDLPDGFFGENLVTQGIDTDETVIGTRWGIGSVVVEATCPRQPCGTFSAWMSNKRWGRIFSETGRSGAYFKVVTEGCVQAGDEITVLHVPDHGVTIGHVFRGLTPDQGRALARWAVETGTVLYHSLASAAENASAREGEAAVIPAELRSTGRGLGLGLGH